MFGEDSMHSLMTLIFGRVDIDEIEQTDDTSTVL